MNSMQDSKSNSDLNRSNCQEAKSMKLLTLNIFIRPPLIKNNKSDCKDDRLKYLLKSIVKDYDIIGFQELFGSFSKRRNNFLIECEKLGFHYVLRSPKAHRPFFLVDSGLVTISRFPITDSGFIKYEHGVHSDMLAQKGVLYGLITINQEKNLFLHVFNTHLQASYQDSINKPSFKIRERQIDQLIKFVQTKTCLDKHPVILMGDFNINARMNNQENSQYNLLMYKLKEMKTRESDQAVEMGYDFVDLLFDYNQSHPITFGDVSMTQDEVVPRETVLTHKRDLFSKQRIDYVFYATRREYAANSEQVSYFKNKKLTNDENLYLLPTKCEVEPFFVPADLGLPFTQISDHYGIKTEFSINQ